MDIIYPAILLLAYLSGSISTAIVVCRILTLPDPRLSGSNNPGATNVHRIGGSKAALATLFGDIIKTAAPITLAMWLGYSKTQICWIGVSALLGHCFPIYFGFKGGKGVASLIAILLLIVPRLAILAILSWIVTAWSFQRSSIASITLAIIIAVFSYYFNNDLFLPLLFLSAIVVLRHRKNIANIIEGKEPIIGSKNLPPK
ncbi:glycerol-3-phosphate 1-O-acyltransferase PlsY [Aliikangiella sp. IMCC44359]|uniref:glycerol-3-phosphate 1-O-acyltransferase PlsY n=1 Tax=Aliikangiella sp. IMCC44359 TaxID=3459125 RepID=UPI00403AEF27